MHLYDRVFIAGSVVAKSGGVLDWVKQAQIELLSNGKVFARTSSDAFGEFKIDSLDENSGPCELRISHENFRTISVAATIADESMVLEPIRLTWTPEKIWVKQVDH